MVHYHHPGVGSDTPANLLRVDVAGLVCRHSGHRDLPIAFKMIGGPQHRVVLHARDDHVIARLHEAEQGDVHRVGGAEGKGYPCRVAGKAEKLCQQSASLYDHGLGLDRKLMSRAPWVHSVAAEKLVHELVDRFRLGQRGGRVVKVIIFLHGIILRLMPCPWRLAKPAVLQAVAGGVAPVGSTTAVPVQRLGTHRQHRL